MRLPLDRIHIIKKMLEEGLITRQLLTRVFLLCRRRKVDVIKVLSNYAGMSQKDINQFSIKHFELPEIDLDDIVPNPGVIMMAPPDSISLHKMIPIFQIKGNAFIATANPFNWIGLLKMRQVFNGKCRFVIAPEFQITNIINYGSVINKIEKEMEMV